MSKPTDDPSRAAAPAGSDRGSPRHVLLVFVDGLGLGAPDPATNPVVSGCCPSLAELLREHATAVDATLGVAGLPQSATGQTALLTGLNAPLIMGRHIEGFPGARLRDIIRESNLYRRLLAHAIPCTFANAYFVESADEVAKRRLQSVTTVAALSAFGGVRCLDALERNEAVCHDLTRASLAARGYRGPLIGIPDAARHLAAIAGAHGLTVFEFFLTDRAGHTGDAAEAASVLARLDAFLAALTLLCRAADITLCLTSDHGNIEDMSVRTHTRNPVPFAVRGRGSVFLRSRVRSLMDVAPALCAWLEANQIC